MNGPLSCGGFGTNGDNSIDERGGGNVVFIEYGMNGGGEPLPCCCMVMDDDRGPYSTLHRSFLLFYKTVDGGSDCFYDDVW